MEPPASAAPGSRAAAPAVSALCCALFPLTGGWPAAARTAPAARLGSRRSSRYSPRYSAHVSAGPARPRSWATPWPGNSSASPSPWVRQLRTRPGSATGNGRRLACSCPARCSGWPGSFLCQQARLSTGGRGLARPKQVGWHTNAAAHLSSPGNPRPPPVQESPCSPPPPFRPARRAVSAGPTRADGLSPGPRWPPPSPQPALFCNRAAFCPVVGQAGASTCQGFAVPGPAGETPPGHGQPGRRRSCRNGRSQRRKRWFMVVRYRRLRIHQGTTTTRLEGRRIDPEHPQEHRRQQYRCGAKPRPPEVEVVGCGGKRRTTSRQPPPGVVGRLPPADADADGINYNTPGPWAAGLRQREPGHRPEEIGLEPLAPPSSPLRFKRGKRCADFNQVPTKVAGTAAAWWPGGNQKLSLFAVIAPSPPSFAKVIGVAVFRQTAPGYQFLPARKVAAADPA